MHVQTHVYTCVHAYRHPPNTCVHAKHANAHTHTHTLLTSFFIGEILEGFNLLFIHINRRVCGKQKMQLGEGFLNVTLTLTP